MYIWHILQYEHLQTQLESCFQNHSMISALSYLSSSLLCISTLFIILFPISPALKQNKMLYFILVNMSYSYFILVSVLFNSSLSRLALHITHFHSKDKPRACSGGSNVLVCRSPPVNSMKIMFLQCYHGSIKMHPTFSRR